MHKCTQQAEYLEGTSILVSPPLHCSIFWSTYPSSPRIDAHGHSFEILHAVFGENLWVY